MKKYLYTLIAIVALSAVVGFTSAHIACFTYSKNEQFTDMMQVPVEAGTINGQAFFQALTTDSLYTAIRVANYRLSAGSYFNWQTLPGGRTIIVTAGEGYYQSKGKEAILIRKGDTVETIPGLYHWIGATPDAPLEFISVTSQKSDELVRWHEQLTSAEYLQVTKNIK